MQLRYHQLVGKRVVTSDGQEIGRVADLLAEPAGEALRVMALHVGPAALLQRIAFHRLRLFELIPPRTIPWALVARIDREVHLRSTAEQVAAIDESEWAWMAYDRTGADRR